MSLSDKARNRLAGLWGAYDDHLIKEKHFSTDADLAEKFLEHYTTIWSKAKVLLDADSNDKRLEEYYPPLLDGYHRVSARLDQELLQNLNEVKDIVYEWAQRKIGRITDKSSVETLQTHLMFKKLYYGKGQSLSFRTAQGLKSKSEIAKTLRRYRPWSIDHAIAEIGGKQQLFEHMMKIVVKSNSPSEKRLFFRWWHLSDKTDRPMLFPQVSGTAQGYFSLKDATANTSFALHFDFGLINVRNHNKILIECDSRRYHSNDSAYQNDRDRQNVAVISGWRVLRWTYEDVNSKLDEKLESIRDELFYSRSL
jgi:hypothetical protein